MKVAQRMERLMPEGVPRWIRCYDNGGESADRYTVIFTGAALSKRMKDPSGVRWVPHLALSEYPYHPQGVGLHLSYPQASDTLRFRGGKTTKGHWAPALGRRCHLGRRIRFDDLPPDCRQIVVEDYKDFWNLREDTAP